MPHHPVPANLAPWYDVHGPHKFIVVATNQVVFICHDCQIGITLDSIEAGFYVTEWAARHPDDPIQPLFKIEEPPL